VAVVWNGLNGTRRVWLDGAKDAGAKVLVFENSPFPESVTVDSKGVNFANGLPRHIGPYQKWLTENPSATELPQVTAARISQRRPVSKLTSGVADMPPLDSPFVFVPLQFQGDSQLRLFGGMCRTVEATIDCVCDAARHLPKNWHVRMKEHPSDPRSFKEHLKVVGAGLPVFIDNQTDTFDQVRAARLVCTVNSSVGLEAMLLGRPVAVMGQAFWAISDLAAICDTMQALRTVFSDPALHSFDQAARQAFLSFLVSEYYPKLTKSETGLSMDSDERAKVIRRLDRPFGSGPLQ
jgi:capsular polysaccharide export protein